jgi:hypothetical protein
MQGGSNMTGTNCDLFTHKSSRSYLNHLVLWDKPYVCLNLTKGSDIMGQNKSENTQTFSFIACDNDVLTRGSSCCKEAFSCHFQGSSESRKMPIWLIQSGYIAKVWPVNHWNEKLVSEGTGVQQDHQLVTTPERHPPSLQIQQLIFQLCILTSHMIGILNYTTAKTSKLA